MTPQLKNTTQKEANQVAAVASAASPLVRIRALAVLPPFKGPDGTEFPSIGVNKIAEVPRSIAETLVKTKKAVIVPAEAAGVQVSETTEEATVEKPVATLKAPKKAAEPKVEAKPADPTFGLASDEGILLTGKANALSDIVRRFCVPTNGKEALINPLPLRIAGNKIETQANSRFKGLAVFGAFPVEHQGEGEVCVDPIEFQSFLDLYGDQHVAVHFSPEGRITVQGERRSSSFYALAEKPPFYVPSFKESSDGHVTFKNGKATQWVASIKAKELSDAASPSNLLGVKTWTLIGDLDGLTVSIGSVEGKGRTVRTRVPANFNRGESVECGSEFGEDFGTLMNVIDGDIEVATGGDVPHGTAKMPAIIRNGPLTYTVMPRKNQAE